MRTPVFSSYALLLFLALLDVPPVLMAQGEMNKGAMVKQESLYHRLGGYDAIAAVTDDFIGRLVADKALTRFFGGAGTDTQKRFRQHLVDQLCAVTGGPCFYAGRDMKSAHGGLGITEAEWQSGVTDLVASLDRFKVPQKEKGELIGIVATTKKDIVEKP